MFFPNELLVKRTPGIATVWLMATLGNRQNSKKVNKSEILKVNIPEACNAVHNPEAPMALRLQSNLLYGISRVYSQKCVYILTDTEAAENALRNLFKLVRTSELDPRAGRAKPETLVVPDDPLFLPDLQFPIVDFDASIFDSSGGSWLSASDVSAISHASSRSAGSLHESELPQLDIPGSDSLSGGLGFQLPGSRAGSYHPRLSVDLEEPRIEDDLGFQFDATGMLIDLDEPHNATVPDNPAAPEVEDPPAPTVDEADHETAQSVNEEAQQTQDNGFVPVDDFELMQDTTERDPSNVETQSTETTNTSEYLQAPQKRRKPTSRAQLQPDVIYSLSNGELRRWNTNYLANMKEARKAKESKQSSRRAKANALSVMRSTGLTGVNQAIASPLVNFAAAIMQQLTGITDEKPKTIKRKRHRSTSSSTSESETRRTRLRVEDEAESARGERIEEEGLVPMAGEEDPSIELARKAVAMMEDHSTQLALPWSGSRAGSVRSGRHSRQASIISGRAPGSAIRGTSVNSFDRRASRIPSVSPAARGSIHPSSVARFSNTGIEDDFQLPAFDSEPQTSPRRSAATAQDFDLFGPAAEVSTQEAEESQWLRKAMNKESAEFLAWIKNSIASKQSEDEEDTPATIRFDELLPHKQHSKPVAAQGFLHMLVLASRGAINVVQEVDDSHAEDRWWGPLHIGVVEQDVSGLEDIEDVQE